MKTMQDFIAVNENADGIIGRFFYYSASGIIINKMKFVDIGMSFGLSKYQPARESKSGAFRRATTALKDRIVTKDARGTHIWNISCHDNKKDNAEQLCRELVKETQNKDTNDYHKLANIIFDRRSETIIFDNVINDPDINTADFCDKAAELYELYRTCYTTDQVNAVIQPMLDKMEANKISIYGNLYFIPSTHLSELALLEDYIESVAENNLSKDAKVICNSMDVADVEKQRIKMADEFYTNYKNDIKAYQNVIQNFIDNGNNNATVINRWLMKIEALEKKKHTYEHILKQRLDNLDSDFSFLTLQADELRVRNIKGQTALADVA